MVKIVLGRYVKSVGEKVHSDSLVNSGEDATLDSVISASTLVAAAIYLIFHISLEAWLGALIALVIIRSGVGMLRETLSRILGERADAELARNIKATVVSHPEISGAYDLVLHNYGPDTYNGSVHIEVPDTLSAEFQAGLKVDMSDLLPGMQLNVLPFLIPVTIKTYTDGAVRVGLGLNASIWKFRITAAMSNGFGGNIPYTNTPLKPNNKVITLGLTYDL
jgi:hypothetical protein